MGIFGNNKIEAKNMKTLSKDQLTKIFNDKSEETRVDGRRSGMTGVLEQLGAIVNDMKDLNMDVDLEMHGSTSELAFDMFDGADDSIDVGASGILRIGSHHKLIAVATEVNNKACLQLAISDFDIRYNGKGDVESTVYDMQKDSDAMTNLQKEILTEYAAVTYIKESLKLKAPQA